MQTLKVKGQVVNKLVETHGRRTDTTDFITFLLVDAVGNQVDYSLLVASLSLQLSLLTDCAGTRSSAIGRVHPFPLWLLNQMIVDADLLHV